MQRLRLTCFRYWDLVHDTTSWIDTTELRVLSFFGLLLLADCPCRGGRLAMGSREKRCRYDGLPRPPAKGTRPPAVSITIYIADILTRLSGFGCSLRNNFGCGRSTKAAQWPLLPSAGVRVLGKQPILKHAFASHIHWKCYSLNTRTTGKGHKVRGQILVTPGCHLGNVSAFSLCRLIPEEEPVTLDKYQSM